MRYVYSELWSKGGKPMPRIPITITYICRTYTKKDKRQKHSIGKRWQIIFSFLTLKSTTVTFRDSVSWIGPRNETMCTGCEREHDRMRQLIFLVPFRRLIVLPLRQNLFLLQSPFRNEQFMVINWPDGPIKKDFAGNHIGRNDTIRTASANERSNRWKTRTVWQMSKRLPLKTINMERGTATNLLLLSLVLCNKLPSFSNAVNF